MLDVFDHDHLDGVELSVVKCGGQWSLYADGHYVRELTRAEVGGLQSGRLTLADLVSWQLRPVPAVSVRNG